MLYPIEYDFSKESLSWYHGLLFFILFLIYMHIFSELESKYVWDRYNVIHENDLHPMTFGVLLGYLFQLLL